MFEPIEKKSEATEEPASDDDKKEEPVMPERQTNTSLFPPKNPGLIDVEKDQRMHNFVRLSPKERLNLTCDEIFVLYLGNVSKQVNAVYFRTVMKFILLYRDCLNSIGWTKRHEHLFKCNKS